MEIETISDPTFRITLTNKERSDIYNELHAILFELPGYSPALQTLEDALGNTGIPLEDDGQSDFEKWASKQPQDNYVYTLGCGHEIDSEHAYPKGVLAYCRVDGWSSIVK